MLQLQEPGTPLAGLRALRLTGGSHSLLVDRMSGHTWQEVRIYIRLEHVVFPFDDDVLGVL